MLFSSFWLSFVLNIFYCDGTFLMPKFDDNKIPDVDLNEENLNKLLPETTEACREDIRSRLHESQERILRNAKKGYPIIKYSTLECGIVYSHFKFLKNVQQCNNSGDKEYFNALNNLLLEELSNCSLFPSCTLNDFFRKCWINQLVGLHYIPPIVTDITPADEGRYVKRFLEFSNKATQNVCCLIKRAKVCEEQFIENNCTFANKRISERFSKYIKKTFMENYWKTTIRPIYLEEPFEILKCGELESVIDVCKSDGAEFICFQLTLIICIIFNIFMD